MKKLYNIGYVGTGKFLSTTHPKIYRSWSSMFVRCYSNIYESYEECTVCEEWWNFQNFAEWFLLNYKDNYHLDKDILIPGNKIYSPKTCCFVPMEINNLFTKRNKSRGKYPMGITENGKKFRAQLNIFGKIKLLGGAFNSPEEAFEIYKIEKEKHIKNVADKWKNQISENVYNALLNYRVNISD